MSGITPDALVSSFMILTVTALVWGIAKNELPAYVAVGLFAGLAFWTKAFAFPFFFLLLLLAVAANIRKRHVLLRLAISLVVFGLIAGPYIWQMSAAKGRLTFGDSGRLNTAWHVNGTDRFNPVADFTAYQRGTANVSLKHPGELLSQSPAIAYYGRDRVYGSTPQWNDPSYWSDGVSPRFALRQTLANFKQNLGALCGIAVMRFQALLLVAALCCWSFTVRRSSLADPILVAVFLLAIGCVASYSLVLIEGRYVVFSFVILGTLFAASALARRPGAEHRSLHQAILLVAALILINAFQTSLREWKSAKAEGDQPLHGVYNIAVVSAGAELATLYPRGSEVACMGHDTCLGDTYWAKFAGVKVTANIETGHGEASTSAETSCPKLEANPAALDALRQHHIRAIVSRFDGPLPCSAAWKPLGKSPNFFYLPL
jgi:4-amino-4-deoxy-L-arabinose transferase-like glycosyltransferase